MKTDRKKEGKLELRCMAIRIITVRNWTKQTSAVDLVIADVWEREVETRRGIFKA